MIVQEDFLPGVRDLMGKVNKNLLGNHLPETLRIQQMDLDFNGETGEFDIKLTVEKSESAQGHNWVKNPATGKFHEIRTRDNNPVFTAVEFPGWVLEHVN
jgi:hypothetical protein